ncbi:hypothetical protein IMG5_133240 [Ichthyophthirius multifiliis]|uniref:Uncharacterized protein n=1 Tax=Ichthyophthirius multifiliis TaxID=5932 RepID=G0QWL2_ICHMU|nr:hypothetical protein IMG5_133240 [Ichthyophthirius multifiliis]EGR30387.1 hypothetical protein IMG5_133240 [Ichthyophthirius multifiliis]|eukprot:XP_004031974.1 hypothetical protein IMG5_133240 [Ichthyophthirius multifiliis]
MPYCTQKYAVYADLYINKIIAINWKYKKYVENIYYQEFNYSNVIQELQMNFGMHFLYLIIRQDFNIIQNVNLRECMNQFMHCINKEEQQKKQKKYLINQIMIIKKCTRKKSLKQHIIILLLYKDLS